MLGMARLGRMILKKSLPLLYCLAQRDLATLSDDRIAKTRRFLDHLRFLDSVQEHTRKSLPTLVEKRISTGKQRQRVEGMTYDIDLAANAVKTMRKSDLHFQVHDLSYFSMTNNWRFKWLMIKK